VRSDAGAGSSGRQGASSVVREIWRRTRSVEATVVRIRHRLHARPELSGSEAATAKIVEGRLRRLGLEPRSQVGGHGVVAEIHGDQPGRTLLLRADMDALPIHEAGEKPYRSCRAGVMHACGHDGHTAILLGVATVLMSLRNRLRGRVRLVFQPAEETVDGARAMCAEGAADGVDGALALHGWPGLPLGTVAISPGPNMAAADMFRCEIRGRGGHAAYPHEARDPIVAAANVVLAWQTIVSRHVPPQEPAVLTVGRIAAGSAHNIIPEGAWLQGTVRTISGDLRAQMPGLLQRIGDGVCAAHGTTCEVAYSYGPPAVVNDPRMAALVERAATDMLGPDRVHPIGAPSMGGEDFAEFMQRAPGALFRLGLGEVAPIHTPEFDFADDALAAGVAVFCRAATLFLSDPSDA